MRGRSIKKKTLHIHRQNNPLTTTKIKFLTKLAAKINHKQIKLQQIQISTYITNTSHFPLLIFFYD